MIATLLRDRIVPVALLVMLVMAVPYARPVFPRPVFEYYAFYAPTIVFLGVLVLALRRGLRAVRPAAERLFWDLWSLAACFWLAQALVGLATVDRPRPAFTFAQDVLLVGFYTSLLLAARLSPDRSDEVPPPDLLRTLEVAGTALFCFGFFAYFSLVPFLYDQPILATDVPSLVFYTVLDAVVVVRFAVRLGEATSPRWRALYGWLLAGVVLWFLGDVLETLMYVDIVRWQPPGSPSDLLWWLPFVPLLVAARLRVHPFPPTHAGGDADEALSRRRHDWGDPLVAYAAAFPLVHFILGRAEALEPATRDAREALSLGFLVVLAGMAVAYQRRLLEVNRRLDEMRLRAVHVEHRAYHDALTGLPNRYLLQDRLMIALARARRAGTRVAVLFLDLDRFKVVNDSLGHSAGDRLLGEVATRLGRHVRQGDTLARFGGDEFTILVEAIHNVEDTAKIAQSLREALKDPLVLDGRELYVTASIGISVFPDDGVDAETLVKNSDIAMYRAKDLGGDGYQLYRLEMNSRVEERFALESSLRRARSLEQFALQYQPIVEVADGRCLCCEALLRWRHPEKGLLLPGAFLEVAEMIGVMRGLGPWVIREACGQSAAWLREGARFRVAVNLSAHEFLEKELAGRVGAVLAETRLAADLLELEITESLAMQKPEITRSTLRDLRALGVRLAIDDFGTGYSSLSFLREFPIDTLKVDRTFVRDIDRDSGAATIVATVIAMARTLGLQVVAEGVEREEQLRVLRELGCDRAQGYLFGRPLWPGALPGHVRAGGRTPPEPGALPGLIGG
ncbi:MAG TPA: EAL domain-containing protein [Vicinamibacteria bacterium]